MESYNGPPVRPPSPGDKKKAEGSFARRNNWVIIVIIAVLLIAAGGWFLVSRVNTLKRVYSVNIPQDSAVNDSDDYNSPNHKIVYELDTVFAKPYLAAKIVKLNIKGAAMCYKLLDTTSQLFTADTRAFHNRFQLDSHKEDSVYVMNFISNNTKSWGDGSDTAYLKFNINPEWEINIQAGATDLDFDLSKYKVKELKLSGGAGQFVVKMGLPLQATNINVSTGAADITIAVPKDAACSINTNSGLSSNTFDGFIKKDDDHYETPGFKSAKNKIFIHFEGGVSVFKVEK